MGRLFGNPAGTHIAANLAGWHVGQNIGATELRTSGAELVHSPTTPIEQRLATGEVSARQVHNTGAEVTAVAFGYEAAVEELSRNAQQAAGELAS